jgi:hypothetical protein
MKTEYYYWTSRRVDRRNKSQEIGVFESKDGDSENNVIV